MRPSLSHTLPRAGSRIARHRGAGSGFARRLAGCVALIAILGVANTACSTGGGSAPTRIPRSPTATPRPSPTPLPSVFELLANGGLGVIEVAYNRIVDEHVTPVDEAGLLTAAWDGVQSAARSVDETAPPGPSFTGDRAVDIARFRAAWLALPESVREYPPTRWEAISSMAKSVNDCHTYFLGPSLNSDSSEPERALSGYGMTLMNQPPVVTLIEKEPWSPAAVSGIQPGDTLLSIDDEDTTHMGPLDVLIFLDGRKEGTSVEIKVQRPGEALPLTKTLALSPYEPKNLQPKVLDGGIGYVRIHDWGDRRVTQQLREALTRFDKSKVTSWIIDLRGNPGGLASPDAISLFVRDGVAIRARERDGSILDDPASGAFLPNLKPLALLVDDGSASMSEIFALALQEHHAAHLVGTKTDGCIGATFIDDIGDGSGLGVTFETMLGPVTGAELNGIGVTPDEVVPRTVDDIVAGRDPQLEAAVAHLQESARAD